MRSLGILFSTFILIILLANPSFAAVENLYVEERSGYHYLDGEIMRFSEDREFTIKDSEFYNQTFGNQVFPYVNITLTTANDFGTYETISQPIEPTNFDPQLTFWSDGTLKNVEWNIRLYRLTDDRIPYIFGGVADTVFGDGSLGSKRVDLVIDPPVFTLALEHYEYKIVDGEMQKVKVNTEFTTDNDETGRVIRTAIHIIKRAPDETILFKSSTSINKVDTVSRGLNILDQPFLWVPYQLGAIFLMVYIYIRVSRYVKENNIKLVKEDAIKEEIEINEEEN